MFLGIPEYLKCPPAWFYTRILVGPGAVLTPRFARAHGITHVINCSFDNYSPIWFRTHYPDEYVVLNAVDSLSVNILDWYPTFETTMRKFLQSGSGTVYVHCQAGMNRSGFLALAYVAKNFGIGLEELKAATLRQRPVLFQNPVFMNQVKQFINGRVQSEKNTRLDVDRIDDGNSGLITSGYYKGTLRIEDYAGEPKA